MRKVFMLFLVMTVCMVSGCEKKPNNSTIDDGNEKEEIQIIGENEVFIDEEIVLTINQEVEGFIWKSENEEIATVHEGVVKGINKGEVVIYLEKDGDRVSEHKILVKSYIPERIEIINILEVYEVGETVYQLQARAYPEYSLQEFVWEGTLSKMNLNSETGEVQFLDDGDIYIVCRSKLDKSVFKTVKLNVKYPDNVKVTNILFIGNSLTYRNDVPGMVSKLAKADGKVVKCDSYTVGGNTLGQILSTRSFYIKQMLNSKKYDYIIIQEASSSNYLEFENFLSAAKEFKRLADENGAELILYQTWAYNYETYHTRYYQQQRIIEAYDRVAQELGVRVNIVGEVFFDFTMDYPDINFYDDLNHASLAGSYLASCVHYISLFDSNLIDNTFTDNLDPEIARIIREYVQNYFLRIIN